ncbi:NAD-dependent epimerase/dehydratase family protein [Paenibacillus roseus]|uniref:NAD-dependent epimerase/dehydratase family protein n=1 Tax=Paenibacillus roseus TaxID=2798579 RepID=A0A934JBK5_9BACL|nr:NAD-dependent epimerase/dehydratase family protein [Paenibacillus roseus]MBJ6363808.1 NAD-dependent epimerase/dehydratase family protein [Paenibacillus roseus]
MSSTGPHILVTGAGGFCGEHACRYFASRGMKVTAAVRTAASGSPRTANTRVEWPAAVESRTCELTDREQVNRLIHGAQPDYILHLAGLNAVKPSWQDPIAYMETNLLATAYLLDAAHSLKKSVKVLIAGSMLRFKLPQDDELPKPSHPYGMSKTLQVLIGQCWAQLYRMEVLIAQPSNLIGPGRSTGLCSLLARYTVQREEACSTLQTSSFQLSSRTEKRDFLDVRDAMTAYETILLKGKPGIIYPVVSGRMITLGEVADTFSELALCPLDIQIGSSAAPSPASEDGRPMQEMGWRPHIPFRDSIRDLLVHVRLGR